MAKAASTPKVTLQDDTELELRTLNIKLYRKFQDRWSEMIESETENPNDRVDDLIDLAVICVSRELGDRANDREWLEEAFDFDSIYLILKECAGVDLNPANAVATAMAVQSGANSR